MRAGKGDSGKGDSGKGAASIVAEAIRTARAAGASGEILVRGTARTAPARWSTPV